MPSSGVQTCADRKSTRLNSSHGSISYAVFCLKKNNTRLNPTHVPTTIADSRLQHSTQALTRTRSPHGRPHLRDSSPPISVLFFFFFLMIRGPPRSPLFPSRPSFR